MATSLFAYPLGVPVYRAYDANGDPLNGGKLYCYVAGTSTPLDTYPTYSDALAGTNANANPVVLDSAGAAQVWVQASAYKFILKSSADVTLYTQDNVYAAFGFPPTAATTLTTVIKNGDQTTISSAAKITTWSAEFDALSEWSAANHRWVASGAGKYRADLSVEATDISTANSVLSFFIYKNGSAVGRIVSRGSATIGQIWGYNAHWAGSLAAGDYLEVYASASTNMTVKGSIGTRFTIARVP